MRKKPSPEFIAGRVRVRRQKGERLKRKKKQEQKPKS